MNRLISPIMIFSILLGFIIMLVNIDNIPQGYEKLIFLPLVYLLTFFIFIRPILSKVSSITIYMVLVLSIIRYLIGPLLISLTGYKGGIDYFYVNQESIDVAFLLMIWEIIAVNVSIYLFVKFYFIKKSCQIPQKVTLRLIGNPLYYLIFIVVSFLIFMFFGRGQGLINFFIIQPSNERLGDIVQTNLVLVRQFLISGVMYLFLIITNYYYSKYNERKKNIYMYGALIIALLNVSIIVGERRSVQLYTAFVSIYILSVLFKNHKTKIISAIFILSFIIIFFMSVYKFNNAFLYGSYSQAIKSNPIDLNEYSSIIQSYFFGVQNVAISIQLSTVMDYNIFQVPYDFLRVVFGISFLLKDQMQTTSDIFNTFIYGVYMPSGHVISGIGYGYLYLGFILSPFFILLNIFIAFWVEIKLRTTLSLEMAYIWGYILIRFTSNMFASTPPLINLGTLMLGTAGLVYFVAKILNLPKKIQQTN